MLQCVLKPVSLRREGTPGKLVISGYQLVTAYMSLPCSRLQQEKFPVIERIGKEHIFFPVRRSKISSIMIDGREAKHLVRERKQHFRFVCSEIHHGHRHFPRIVSDRRDHFIWSEEPGIGIKKILR